MDDKALRPAEYAKLRRISVEKVLRWIRDGELPAVNMAHLGSKRPRYLIYWRDIVAFERSRKTVAEPKTKRQSRRRKQGETPRYV